MQETKVRRRKAVKNDVSKSLANVSQHSSIFNIDEEIDDTNENFNENSCAEIDLVANEIESSVGSSTELRRSS